MTTTLRSYDLHGFLGLGQVEGERLVAHYVKACLGKRPGNFEVRMVGRGDGNEINALPLGELLLGLRHFLVGSIGTLRRDAVIEGGGLGLPGGIGATSASRRSGRASDAIQDGGDAVDAADERALAAAHQAHAQLTVEGSVESIDGVSSFCKKQCGVRSAE